MRTLNLIMLLSLKYLLQLVESGLLKNEYFIGKNYPN